MLRSYRARREVPGAHVYIACNPVLVGDRSLQDIVARDDAIAGDEAHCQREQDEDKGLCHHRRSCFLCEKGFGREQGGGVCASVVVASIRVMG